MNALGFKDIAIIISLTVTIIGGGIWVGGIDERVSALRGREDLSDDVAAMKTQLNHLDRQLDRIERKIDKQN